MALEQRGKQDARTGDEFVAEKADQGMHRRAALKVGAALATGGAVGLLGGQATAAKPQAPAVLTGKQAGRKFRAWVQEGLWVGGKAGVEELRLKELHSRQVVVRTEASAPCYSLCQRGIGGRHVVVRFAHGRVIYRHHRNGHCGRLRIFSAVVRSVSKAVRAVVIGVGRVGKRAARIQRQRTICGCRNQSCSQTITVGVRIVG